MSEDKYAPKANDGVDKVHQLHRDLIKQQQEENKKAREKKVVPAPVVKHDEPAPATPQ